MRDAEEIEGAHLELRAQLIEALRDVIRRKGLRQREAAALFGVAQPRVSDLVRGKLMLFSIDTLVTMLAAAGVTVELSTRARSERGRGHRGRRAKSSRRSPPSEDAPAP